MLKNKYKKGVHMHGCNGRRKKIVVMTMVFFIFSAVGSALPLPDRNNGGNKTGFIEKERPANEKTIRKGGFPWLWVLGGAVAAGVVIYLLVNKNSSAEKDPDLELEWLLSGNAQDSSGKNRHGTIRGAVAVTDRKGAANGAFSFDGISQYIVGPNFIGQKNNQVSASLWLKTKPDYQYEWAVLGNDFGIAINGDKVGMGISLPSTNSVLASIPHDVWTHFVGTYDGQTISIYINGALAGTKNHPGNISNQNISFTVGQSSNSFWSGAVDDIRIYSRVLSQSDITKLYTE
jgi:hypothetical protein